MSDITKIDDVQKLINNINEILVVFRDNEFHLLGYDDKFKFVTNFINYFNQLDSKIKSENTSETNRFTLHKFFNNCVNDIIDIFNTDDWIHDFNDVYNIKHDVYNNDNSDSKRYNTRNIKYNIVSTIDQIISQHKSNSRFLTKIKNNLDQYKKNFLESDGLITDEVDLPEWGGIKAYHNEKTKISRINDNNKIKTSIKNEISRLESIIKKELQDKKSIPVIKDNSTEKDLENYYTKTREYLIKEIDRNLTSIDNEIIQIKSQLEIEQSQNDEKYVVSLDDYPIIKIVLSISIGVHLGVIYKFFTKTKRIKNMNIDDKDTFDSLYNGFIVVLILFTVGFIKKYESEQFVNFLYTLLSILIVFLMSNILYADDIIYTKPDNILYVYVYSYVFLLGFIYYLIVNANSYLGGTGNKKVLGIITFSLGAIYIMPILKQININQGKIGKGSGRGKEGYDDDKRGELQLNDMPDDSENINNGRGWFYLLFDIAMISISIITIYIFSVFDGYILSYNSTIDNYNKFIHYILIILFFIGLIILPAYAVDCNGNAVSIFDIVITRNDINIDSEGRKQLKILYHLIFYFIVATIALNILVFNYFHNTNYSTVKENTIGILTSDKEIKEKEKNKITKELDEFKKKYIEYKELSEKYDTEIITNKIEEITEKLYKSESKSDIKLIDIYLQLDLANQSKNFINDDAKLDEKLTDIPYYYSNYYYYPPFVYDKFNSTFKPLTDKYMELMQNEKPDVENIINFNKKLIDEYYKYRKYFNIFLILGKKTPFGMISDLIIKVDDENRKIITKELDNVIKEARIKECNNSTAAPQIGGDSSTPCNNLSKGQLFGEVVRKAAKQAKEEEVAAAASLAAAAKEAVNTSEKIAIELEKAAAEKAEANMKLTTTIDELNDLKVKLAEAEQAKAEADTAVETAKAEAETAKTAKAEADTAVEKAKAEAETAVETAKVEAATAKAEAEAAKKAAEAEAATAKAEAATAKKAAKAEADTAKTELVESKGVSAGKISKLKSNLKSAQKNLAAAKEAESGAIVNREQAITNKKRLETEIIELKTEIKKLESKKFVDNNKIDKVIQNIDNKISKLMPGEYAQNYNKKRARREQERLNEIKNKLEKLKT